MTKAAPSPAYKSLQDEIQYGTHRLSEMHTQQQKERSKKNIGQNENREIYRPEHFFTIGSFHANAISTTILM